MKKIIAAPKSHHSALRTNPIARGATIEPAVSSCGGTKSSPTSDCSCPKGRRSRSCIFGESERLYIARRRRSTLSFSCSEGSIAQFYHARASQFEAVDVGRPLFKTQFFV